MSTHVTLTDGDYDDMHHAIGRKGIENPYRNHYCTETDGEVARRFEAIGCWDLRRKINDGRDAIYCLNEQGFEKLRMWLAGRGMESQ
jgi:hypothetical protein